MKKEKILKIEGKKQKIVFKKHKKAKRFKISVYPDGEVVVTFPYYLPYFIAQKMVSEKSYWIAQKIDEMKNRASNNSLPRGNAEEYKKMKNKALSIIREKVEKYSKIYGFETGNISIRNQRTRWGSCSTRKNLSFNYKAAFLPERMIDYIVVHEICHLEEFNHSKGFWELVGKTIPDFLIIRKEIRKI